MPNITAQHGRLVRGGSAIFPSSENTVSQYRQKHAITSRPEGTGAYSDDGYGNRGAMQQSEFYLTNTSCHADNVHFPYQMTAASNVVWL